MKFKVVKKKNPQNQEQSKFYLQNVKIGMKTTDDICKEIANASSLTKGDVLNTLSNLNDIIVKWLVEGYSVRLDNLGVFRITLKSTGVEEAEKCTSDVVKHARIRFSSNRQLFKDVQKDIRYQAFSNLKG